VALAVGLVLVWATAVGAQAAGGAGARAREILQVAGVSGGLIVQLGCGDGRLTAALLAGESYRVHGLDTDTGRIRAARAYLRAEGKYGPAAIDHFDGRHLPYAENLVTLVVAEGLGTVSEAEAMRVLAPGGVLCVRRGERWVRTVKPRPGQTDEWTHFLHDAGGNAVAHDTVVAPPARVQWLADPRHARSHEHTPSINALVSTGGRIFYLADGGAIRSLRDPPKWQLVARDAYNGILLWRRAFDAWYPHLVNWGQTPPQLQRRLVAVGRRLYVTLGLHAPLTAIDAETGKTLHTYARTAGAEEIILHKGVLVVAIRTVTEQRASELKKMLRMARRGVSPLDDRDTADPLFKQFRQGERRVPVTIVALDANSPRELWRKTGGEVSGLWTLTLSAAGDRVFYQRGLSVACLDLRTGRSRWSTRAPRLRAVAGGAIACANNKTVAVLDAETGKTRWSRPGLLCNVRDVFLVRDSLWVGGFKPWQGRSSGKRGPAWGPYFATQRDLATGKVLREVEPECPGHHHRCWQNKATDRYILSGRRGVEFVDLRTGEVRWHSWVRGVCRYGVMPCNGLLYAPPHACGCYIAAKLAGFYALAPAPARPAKPAPPSPGLTRGSAFVRVGTARPARTAEDWPTYRHDGQRSGSTRSAVPAKLRRRWRVDVGQTVTAPTMAGGKVFVVSTDAHRLSALDADTGKEVWSFTAGGRVDSPPTIHHGRAIFGGRDGYVYSVRAADGELAWRLRAGPRDRRVVVRGQVESVSPVPGSVLVRDGVVYCTVGRSSYLDGGIDLLRIDPETGRTRSATTIYSPDPNTGLQPAQYGPAAMPGALGEILTADADHVYLRDLVFDPAGRRQPKGNAHLLTLTGFTDGTWPHRSYWIFGTRCSLAGGCSGRARDLVYGRLLVFDASSVYGYGRAGVHWSNQLQDGPYRLFALGRPKGPKRWSKPSPIRVRAMVLAGGVLFAAGPAATRGDGGPAALLLAISAADGSELARCELSAPPVFDGLAAGAGRLYASLETGRVVCLAGRAANN